MVLLLLICAARREPAVPEKYNARIMDIGKLVLCVLVSSGLRSLSGCGLSLLQQAVQPGALKMPLGFGA